MDHMQLGTLAYQHALASTCKQPINTKQTNRTFGLNLHRLELSDNSGLNLTHLSLLFCGYFDSLSSDLFRPFAFVILVWGSSKQVTYPICLLFFLGIFVCFYYDCGDIWSLVQCKGVWIAWLWIFWVMILAEGKIVSGLRMNGR